MESCEPPCGCSLQEQLALLELSNLPIAYIPLFKGEWDKFWITGRLRVQSIIVGLALQQKCEGAHLGVSTILKARERELSTHLGDDGSPYLVISPMAPSIFTRKHLHLHLL